MGADIAINSDTGGAVSMCFERSSIAVLKLVTCIFKLSDLKTRVEDRIQLKNQRIAPSRIRCCSKAAGLASGVAQKKREATVRESLLVILLLIASHGLAEKALVVGSFADPANRISWTPDRDKDDRNDETV